MSNLKKVDSNVDTWQQMCSQTWGLVLYFLGMIPTQEEWEEYPELQRMFWDLPTMLYHTQAMSNHYQRLTKEGEREPTS